MTNVNEDQYLEEGEFEKRADYLNEHDLLNWDVSYPELDNIKKNILSKTPYLIAGPRGTGKTHLFKLINYRCIKDSEAPMSLYVSYKEYYSLEPLLISTSSAIAIFQTWVLAKINLEILHVLTEHNLEIENA